MATCDPQALLNAANCFDCLTNQQLEQVQVQMLCDIVNGGLAGGPFVRISGDTMTGGLIAPTIQVAHLGVGVPASANHGIDIRGNVNVAPAVGHNAINSFENIFGGTTSFVRGGYFGIVTGDVGAVNYNIIEGCAKEVYTGFDVTLGAASNWTGTASIVTGSNNYINNITAGAGVITLGIGEWSRVECSATGIIRKAVGNRISSINAIGADGANAHIAIGMEILNTIVATGGLTNTVYSIYSASTAQSYLEGRLGLGTAVPVSKVDISGNLTVGATYAGVNAATANGAIIEGNLGVGTVSPTVKLDVWGGSMFFRDAGGLYAISFIPGNGVAHQIYPNFFVGGSVQPIIIGVFGQNQLYLDTNNNIGVGGTPNANAILDVMSTTKGFKLPNMTTAQKNAIANTAGLMVFDTNLGKACVNSGAGWETITSV